MSKSRATKPTPAPSGSNASANDKARAEALAKLAAAPAAKPGKPTRPAKSASPNKTAKAATRGTTKRASRATTNGTKRLSALDAAAQVLGSLHAREARVGLTASELIERMADAGLWTSPGGKTPAATLYAAMTREIAAKGTDSRFARADTGADGSRGRFVARKVKP